MYFKGFTGIGRITRTSLPFNPTVTFRFVTADIDLNQGVNFFLPSYADDEINSYKNLRRIVAPLTGDIVGNITLYITENMASTYYDIAYSAEEFTLELYFGEGKARKFTGTKIENLTFDCKAGELVQANIATISKTHEQESNGDTDDFIADTASKRTSTEKIVDWTKTSISSITSKDLASFSYVIANSLIPIKTASSLLISYLPRGIQQVSGNIVVIDVAYPNYANDKYEIYDNSITFKVDNLSVTHRIVNHWSYRTPLSADTIMTTLEWTRVDQLPAP